MAEAYLAAGRLEEALPLAQLYVQLAKLVTGRGHTAWALRLVADIATHRDPPDVDTALPALTESLGLAHELGMQPLEARGMLTRGRFLERVGKRDEARVVLADAAKRFTALRMPFWASACW